MRRRARRGMAVRAYLWTLGAATSIWVNAWIPGARRGETLCARFHRENWRLGKWLCRRFNRIEPDHCRRSRLASRDALHRTRDTLAALVDEIDRETL